jgi:hypothetical protein
MSGLWNCWHGLDVYWWSSPHKYNQRGLVCFLPYTVDRKEHDGGSVSDFQSMAARSSSHADTPEDDSPLQPPIDSESWCRSVSIKIRALQCWPERTSYTPPPPPKCPAAHRLFICRAIPNPKKHDPEWLFLTLSLRHIRVSFLHMPSRPPPVCIYLNLQRHSFLILS